MNSSKTVQYPRRQARGERRRLLERPKLVYGAAFGLAATGAIALVLASVLGSRTSSPEPAAAPLATAAAFAGIPQRGAVLGSPSAPVTLVEYADLQCPFCGAWAREQLPTVVDRLVRTGRLRIVFHGLAFVGPESKTALAGALAAARQSRLWEFVDTMYANQADENSGWVDATIRPAAAATGLDPARWERDRAAGAVLDEIDTLAAGATEAGVSSTPSFAIARTGRTPQLLDTHALDVGSLTTLVDRLAAA